ncbi:DUF1292 domain-containing protein [Metamycoplasma buccale]|uniref:DUF1292 domain-containing protein n=1 Tax=Metamycoplasma buccale TaxID=55602 RepID=UPI00398E4625
MQRNKIELFTKEREIIVEVDNKKQVMYVIFTFEENGDHYFLLTDENELYIAKETSENQLIIINDDDEIDIVTDVVYQFNSENLVLDKEGNDFLAKFIVNNDGVENE